MKKFLVILSSIILTSSTVSGLSGCAATPNGQRNINPDDGGDVSNDRDSYDTDYEKNRIIKQLTSFSESSPIVVKSDDYKTVTSEDAFNILKSKFSEFSDELVLTQTEFTPIEITEDLMPHYGKLTVIADYKDKELINPITNKANFLIPVATTNLKWTNDTVKKLNESMTRTFSKMQIPGSSIPLADPLLWVTSLALFDSLPTVIPTTVDKNDQNWEQWQNFVNKLMDLPYVGEKLENGELDKKITKNILLATANITIKAKYIDILNSLAPDIIHFRNFVIEQREQKKSENLLLLLMQYLFAKPRNIKNDGFLDVNRNIISKKNKNEMVQFSTNLEYILHNLLEGWKNKNGDWPAGTAPISIVIVVKHLWTTTIKIKYEKIPTSFWSFGARTEGIIQFLPISQLKAFVNQFFNYDLTKGLTLKVQIIDKWTIPFGIPLSSEIQKFIPEILKNSGHSSDALENTEIKLQQGLFQFEYQDEKNGEWKTANEIDDLVLALNIRININNIKFNVQSRNDEMISLTTTNDNLYLILVPDINSSILGK